MIASLTHEQLEQENLEQAAVLQNLSRLQTRLIFVGAFRAVLALGLLGVFGYVIQVRFDPAGGFVGGVLVLSSVLLMLWALRDAIRAHQAWEAAYRSYGARALVSHLPTTPHPEQADYTPLY